MKDQIWDDVDNVWNGILNAISSFEMRICALEDESNQKVKRPKRLPEIKIDKEMYSLEKKMEDLLVEMDSQVCTCGLHFKVDSLTLFDEFQRILEDIRKSKDCGGRHFLSPGEKGE